MTSSRPTPPRSTPFSVYVLAFILLGSAVVGCDTSGLSTSAPTDDPRLAGGDLTLFSVSNQSFTLPGPNVKGEQLDLHVEGDEDFADQFVTAPADVNSGLGPAFVRNSCETCHARNGRAPGEVLLRVSVPGTGANGGVKPVPGFGIQIQHNAIFGAVKEATLAIQQETTTGQYADGTSYTLQKPVPDIQDPYTDVPGNVRTSLRMARPVFGLGLLEAVPDATIRDLAARQAATDDGISGRVNEVWNLETQRMDVGRFGWKATMPTLVQQSADAYNHDMGVTSPLLPNEPTTGQPGFDDGLDDDPEVSQHTLETVTFYVQTLGVPARRDLNDAVALRGEELFTSLSCATCHQPKLQTGTLEGVPEVEDQTIYPYTDMLLHDMGDGLADGRPVFGASGQEWRTPPLWGIGLTGLVNPEVGYLHDGRAQTLSEAILWHGGEAKAARNGFQELSADDRDALIAFLKSL